MGNSRLTQLHNTFCSVYYTLCWLIYDDLNPNPTDNRQWVVSGQLCVCWRGETGVMCAAACRALAAQYECWSSFRSSPHAWLLPLSSSQGCFEAVHSPFAVLALETFPESFYSSSPFLVVIFQYMLTVQWVIMGGSIWPHHLWDNLQYVFGWWILWQPSV